MLQAGSWIEQPSLYTDMMDLISRLNDDHDRKEFEKQEKKNKIKKNRFIIA